MARKPAHTMQDWLTRYRDLTRMMYEIRRRCRRLGVLSVSTLHPRHAPPSEQLQLMAALADGHAKQPIAAAGQNRSNPDGQLRWWLTVVWQGGRCGLLALRYTLQVAWLQLRWWRQVRRLLRSPATIVIKTWRFAASFSATGPDFYYGTLQRQLQERGIESVMLWGDDAPGHIDPAFRRVQVQREPARALSEHLLVPLWAPLVSAWRQLGTALALRRLAVRMDNSRLATVCAAACVNSLQFSALHSTVLFYVARAAVRQCRARMFVTLYEGQPWEKTAWHGARAANPACLIVGYQHTAVMPHSFSLLRPNVDSWELSTPDMVLCLGDVTRRMIGPGHTPHDSRLVPFGTFRRLPHPGDERLQDPARRTVLVVPETGAIREAKLLFNVAMRAAARLSDHRFIFRCHPVMPFERVLPHLDGAPERFANVEISRYDAIGEDFARSSVVFYRGSSSVLYAVLHGLKPIYLRDERYEHSDPLFELAEWRESVSSVSELGHALTQYAASSKETAFVQWRRAVEYVRQYVVPVTEASVDRFLEAVGLTGGAPSG